MNILQVSSGEHTAKDGLAILSGNADVDCWGNVTVIAFDDAVCSMTGEGDVTAGGNTKVRVCEDCSADVKDSCSLEAAGKAIFVARGRASVNAHGYTEGSVLEQASLKASGDARVTMISDGSLQVLENATVVYAWPRTKICATVTVAMMQALKDEMETVIRDVAPLYDMNFICALGQMQHELDQGLISKVVTKLLVLRDRISTCAPLVQVFERHGLWPKP